MSPYPLALTSAHFFHSNWRRWWRRERRRRWRSAWWRRGAFLQFLNNLLRSHLQLIQRGALTREEPEDVNVLQGSKNDKSESAFGIKFQVSSWTATATNCHEPTPQLVGRTHNKSGKTMSIIVPKGIWREGCHVLQDIVLISWCGMVKCARKTHAGKPVTRRAAKSPKFRKICLGEKGKMDSVEPRKSSKKCSFLLTMSMRLSSLLAWEDMCGNYVCFELPNAVHGSYCCYHRLLDFESPT